MSYADLDARLRAALRLSHAPVAIRFAADASATPPVDGPFPPPNERGRTGRAPAGCVFWTRGAEDTFATRAEDHANCSVGSYTHGFLTLEEAAGRDDVEAVMGAGWVDAATMRALPRVAEKPDVVTYGPLADAREVPDVVLVRVDGTGLMTLRDAFPDLAIEGKPQCHIVALAKERNAPFASVGCALSRARTGIAPHEMTAALPGRGLEDVVATVEAAAALDREMAKYAAADAKRFAHGRRT